MAELIWEIEPGSLTLESVKEVLAEKVKDRVVDALPPYAITLVDTANITAGAAKALTASLTGGPLAIAGAVVSAAQAINAALDNFAAAFEGEIKSNWTDAVEALSKSLVQQAGGKMLAMYRPSAGNLSLKRAQAATATFKKDGYTKLSQLKSQFKQGYVLGVVRPGRSDYIVATVPVLVYRGKGVFGEWIEHSIYEPDAKAIGPLTPEEGWSAENKWRPLGMDTSYAERLGFSKWIAVAEKLINANPSPPVRWQTMVCPGLAPYWGPWAEELPTGPSLVAYHAALMRSPPPDLDFVAEILANYPLLEDPGSTGILDLLWAREDLARRPEGKKKGLKPRDGQWAGPFWQLVGGSPPSQNNQKGNGGGKFPGMFGEGKGKLAGQKTGGGGGGSGGGLLLVAAGAAGLVLLRKRRR